MNNATRRAMDIELAAEARGMYSRLLNAEEKQRMSQLHSVQDLLSLLTRSEAWHDAALIAQSGELTDSAFSEAVERCVYADYEKLYRFAQDTSREFLAFITLDEELEAIMKALRRLQRPGSPAAEGSDALPPRFRADRRLDKLRRAKSWDELRSACSGGIYAPVLASLELDGKTGLPPLSAAVTAMESRFFGSLASYMRTGYDGPAKRELIRAVSFRADMLNISYLLRLRRFGTPPEKASGLLLSLRGDITREVERAVLAAGSDEEALEIVHGTHAGHWLPRDAGLESPEVLVRAAQIAYFRKVLHGPLNLAAVYAFITLKEYEGDMLRRVFVALQYGLSPAGYMD